MQASREERHLLAHVMKKKGWVDLPSQGTSMFPFIMKGDICRFVSCEAADLLKGDIALFSAANGQLIAHRFYRSITIRDQLYYVFKGDTNLGFDEPIGAQDIIGKLICIRKKRSQIRVTHFIASIWSRLIVSFPVSSRLLRMYVSRRDSL